MGFSCLFPNAKHNAIVVTVDGQQQQRSTEKKYKNDDKLQMRESFLFVLVLFAFDVVTRACVRSLDCIKLVACVYYNLPAKFGLVLSFEKVNYIFHSHTHTHHAPRTTHRMWPMTGHNMTINNHKIMCVCVYSSAHEQIGWNQQKKVKPNEKNHPHTPRGWWWRRRRSVMVDGKKLYACMHTKLLSRILIFISLALSVLLLFLSFFGRYVHMAAASTADDGHGHGDTDDDDELTMSIKFPFNLWPNIKPILNINYTFWSSIRFFASPIGPPVLSCNGRPRQRKRRRQKSHSLSFCCCCCWWCCRCVVICSLRFAQCCFPTQKYFLVFIQFYFRSLCWRQSCHCRT